MDMRRGALALFLHLFLTGTVRSDPAEILKNGANCSAPNQPFQILSYNVENLFDATDDERGSSDSKLSTVQDPTYLPLSLKDGGKRCDQIKSPNYQQMCKQLDWTPDMYERKLERLISALHELFASRQLPDILILEEVENRRVVGDVLNSLRNDGYCQASLPVIMSSKGFGHETLTAIVSRIPIESAAAYPVDLSQYGTDRATRDILEDRFLVQHGKTVAHLAVAANHWPSLAHPAIERWVVAEVVRRRANKAEGLGMDFVAIGDFNTRPDQQPNPIAGHIASNYEPSSLPLVDLFPVADPSRSPPSSYFDNPVWIPLDRALVSPSLLRGRNGLATRSDLVRVLSTKKVNSNPKVRLSLRQPRSKDASWTLAMNCTKPEYFSFYALKAERSTLKSSAVLFIGLSARTTKTTSSIFPTVWLKDTAGGE